MTDPKDAKAAATPSGMSSNSLPDVQKRVGDLQTAVMALRQETAILEGRSHTRDPKLVRALEKENAILKAQIEELSITLTTLLSRVTEAQAAAEAQSLLEQLKSSSIAYFTAAKIDEGKWKDVVSL